MSALDDCPEISDNVYNPCEPCDCPDCNAGKPVPQEDYLNLNLSRPTLNRLLRETFEGEEVHMIDIGDYNIPPNIIHKIDPNYMARGVFRDRVFNYPMETYYPKTEQSYGGMSYLTLKHKNADFLLVAGRTLAEFKWAKRYLFFTDKRIARDLLKKVVRLNRAGKHVRVMGGRDIPFRELAKIPFIKPSQIMATWNKLVHPQLERKAVYNHVLFQGIPGCGKTAFCRYIAPQYPKWFFIVVPPHVIGKPSDVATMYAEARRYKPSVVIFEDIDLIGRNRQDTSAGFDQFLGALLNSLDGIDLVSKVLTIASTNNPSALDPAVVRAGRLGIHVNFGYTPRERLDILRLYYSFPHVTDEALLTYTKTVTSIADLKAIAKVTQVYEEFYGNVVDEDELREIVKQATAKSKFESLPLLDDEDDTPKEIPNTGPAYSYTSDDNYVS